MRANLILIFNHNKSRVLCCLRSKEPFAGKFNFLGGKIEDNESSIDAAYRELFEESGIKRSNIDLLQVMEYKFFDNIYSDETYTMEVYAGKLKADIDVVEEVDELKWIQIDENFFDTNRFAGHGNLGYIINYVETYYNI